MGEQVEVIYENGVLRPIDRLHGHYQEHQHLTVTIEEMAGAEDWLADADPSVSLEAVRQALSKSPSTLAEVVRADREDR